MSSFALMIQGAPYSSGAAHTAFQFCQAALAGGHHIYRLFFFQDGVHNASALCTPPQDEFHLPQAWQQLIRQHQLDAVVCIASALKRGITDSTEATRYQLQGANLLEGFSIGGLGLWAEAMARADRILNFAP